MVIGFDFDRVFIDYPPFLPYSFVEYLYKGSLVFRKNRTKNIVLHYRFPGTLEQQLRILSHYPLFRHLIKENVTALKKISKEKKIKTYLVSSRFGFLQKRTERILEKYELNSYFDGVYFNFQNQQPHIFKEQTIRKLKIDTYVDDDLDLALYLSKKNPTLKIYWIGDGRKADGPLPKNVFVIKDIKELHVLLNKK
jgi:hypothetical protein